MAVFNDVFERKEVKYVLNAQQYEYMIQAISSRMGLDMYGKTTITSIYYDTPHRELICESLEKPLYKEKLRVRNYGPFHDYDCVFIELKKKFKGIVYKRRIGLSRQAAQSFLNGMPYATAIQRYPLVAQGESDIEKIAQINADAASFRSVQIAREISSFMDRHGDLTPSMAIVCERCAWAPLPYQDSTTTDNAEGVRITFDQDIRFYDYRAPDVSASSLGQALVTPCSDDTQHIMKPLDTVMEIKVGGAFPFWLVKALSECGAYPWPFSKYGAAFKQVMCDAHPPKTFSQKIAQQALINETHSRNYTACISTM